MLPQMIEYENKKVHISYMLMAGMKKNIDLYIIRHKESEFSRVISAVCEFYQLTFEQLKNRSRRHEILIPRQMCMYLLARNTTMSLSDIGERFGGFDHTSVINAREKIQDLVDTEERMKNIVQTLEEKIINN